jgi:predicted phage terminase large subunit-like protein
VRGRWEVPDLVRRIIGASHAYQPHTILIEDQASGTALLQILKREQLPVIPVKPKGDKVMRMHAHTATLEAGKVLVPKAATWLDDFRCELHAFPNGQHDDQVDALSQLMTWDMERPRHTFGIHPMNWN